MTYLFLIKIVCFIENNYFDIIKRRIEAELMEKSTVKTADSDGRLLAEILSGKYLMEKKFYFIKFNSSLFFLLCFFFYFYIIIDIFFHAAMLELEGKIFTCFIMRSFLA